MTLAFDFGLRRIGVAAGSALTGTAAPLRAAANGPGGPEWSALDHHVREYKPDQLVVGNPYNDDGSPAALADAAARFATALHARYALPVTRVDESYSSREAHAELKARRADGSRRRRVQRADIDSLAAAIVLERWLRGE